MISRRLLRIKIVQILYAYFSMPIEDCDKHVAEKELNYSIQKTYDLYCGIIKLLPDIKRYAENRIELCKNKNFPTEAELHPNTKFIDNRIIAQIEQCEKLCNYIERNKISWNDNPEVIRDLYNKLTQSKYYTNYMQSSISDFDQDRQCVIKFFINEIENNELLQQTLEERSIYWNDDLEFVVGVIIKTLKNSTEDGPFPLFDLYKNQDDQDFASILFKQTIDESEINKELIGKYVHNWNFDRLAAIDMIILQMAITEMTNFPSIPINVTLNEYIEIAKYYSTVKSGMFINGILDKISLDLKNQGRIIKIGRGLIES